MRTLQSRPRWRWLVLALSSSLLAHADVSIESHLLESWRATQLEILRRSHPHARLELLDEQLYRTEVDPAIEPEDAVIAVATVRIRDGAQCRVQWRRLAVTVAKGGERARVSDDRLLGQDCCDPSGACERTPGDWMVHLARVCHADETSPAVAALIDPQHVPVVDETSDEASHGLRYTRRKIRRRDASELCHLMFSIFACPESFGSDGNATCRSRYRGENWDFTWSRRAGAAVIAGIKGTIRN
jgi:hypothetical protein